MQSHDIISLPISPSSFQDDLSRRMGGGGCTSLQLSPVTSASEFLQTPNRWAATVAVPPIQWGTKHPVKMMNEHGKRVARAKWTDEEVTYIYKWCKMQMRTNPCVSFKVSKCLSHILADPDAIAIFHSLHTLDSSRLMTGFKKLQEKSCEHRYDDDYFAVMMWFFKSV